MNFFFFLNIQIQYQTVSFQTHKKVSAVCQYQSKNANLIWRIGLIIIITIFLYFQMYLEDLTELIYSTLSQHLAHVSLMCLVWDSKLLEVSWKNLTVFPINSLLHAQAIVEPGSHKQKLKLLLKMLNGLIQTKSHAVGSK